MYKTENCTFIREIILSALSMMQYAHSLSMS
jgi:hypothetical protein